MSKITKAQFNGALKSVVSLDAKLRKAMTTTFTYIAFYSLKDGNKAPLDQLKDKNGVPAWIKAGANRAIMSQDTRYRTAQEDGWNLAERHAVTIVESMLDKKADDSAEAKAKREAAKAKREAEALKLKEQESELQAVQDEKEKLELELAKTKSKLKDATPKRTGGRVTKQESTLPGKVTQEKSYKLIHIAGEGNGRDEVLDLTAEEYAVALEAVHAHRKAEGAPKRTGTNG